MGWLVLALLLHAGCAATLAGNVVDAEYKFRPYEGVGNNFKNPRYGHVGEHLLRKSAAEYNTDTQLSLHGNPNPRIVSNHICKGSPVESPKNLSNITWAWAQFVDHQLDLTVNQSGESAETIEIPVPDTETDPEEDFYFCMGGNGEDEDEDDRRRQ